MIGRIVSHYRIVEQLGEGGMGVVYKADDLKLPRSVALKFVPPHLVVSQEATTRLEQEAGAISALNHGNIATIHGLDEVDGQKFLVLEYLPGGTLKSKISESRRTGQGLSLPQALDYAIQIAEGLAHAHRHGIVHRDVKPSNVMFTEEGTAKITDFGLAQRVDRPETSDGYGTPGYMSPEQEHGLQVDHRSDIFSLGVLLFELIAGQLPFRESTPEALPSELPPAPAPLLKQFRDAIPDELQRIVDRALERDRNKRYQNMNEVLADLRSLREQIRRISEDDTIPVPPKPDPPPWNVWGAAKAIVAKVIEQVESSWKAWTTGATLALAGVLLVIFWPPQKHLAVLPFTNLGGDPANQPFCDGLLETVTNQATQLQRFDKSLWVVPASDVRSEPVTSVRQAQRVLGVTLVVSGSVQRLGETVRLTVNLIDARRDRHVDEFEVDIPIADLTVLQDSLTEKLARMLGVKWRPQARQVLTAGGTQVPAAYHFYLQGQGYLQRGPEGVIHAITLFQQAIEKDPQYALAYAGLGEAYLQMYNLTKDPQRIEDARRNCNLALERNAGLAPVHLTLGLVYAGTGRYDEAVQEYRRALELDPSSGGAYANLGEAYEALNRPKDVEATYNRAIELQRGYWGGYRNLGRYYYRRGLYAQAEPLFRRATELAPDNIVGHNNLGALYLRTGRYAEAAKSLETSLALKPNPTGYSNLGTVYFFQGRYAEAVPMYENAIQLSAGNATLWGNLANMYRWAGQREKSREAYGQAIQLAERGLGVNPRDAELRSSLAVFWAHLGNKDKALEEIGQARKLDPRNVNVLFKCVRVYEVIGDRDRALSALQDTLRADPSMEEVRRHPDLAELRKDPRFDRLMRGRSRGP